MRKAPARASKQKSHFYIGIGGWTFPPWSGVFYPENAPRSGRSTEESTNPNYSKGLRALLEAVRYI